MDQAPGASDRIADSRAMSGFGVFGDPMTGGEADTACGRPDHIFSLGLQGFALPLVLRSRRRSARAGFAPALDAGRVPDPAGDDHEGCGEDDAVRSH
jgi:hypothetical protein